MCLNLVIIKIIQIISTNLRVYNKATAEYNRVSGKWINLMQYNLYCTYTQIQ